MVARKRIFCANPEKQQNSLKECSRMQSWPAAMVRDVGPLRSVYRSPSLRLWVKLPSALPNFELPQVFISSPSCYFSLENFLQFTHHAHQVYLSLSFPCRNRNILIYIITFADRLSNPNPKNKAALWKRMQTHWKWLIRKNDICWQQSIFLLEKSQKYDCILYSHVNSVSFASKIPVGTRQGEDHRILSVSSVKGWVLEGVIWVGSTLRSIWKRTWGFSCPHYELKGFLSAEGQSVSMIPM